MKAFFSLDLLSDITDVSPIKFFIFFFFLKKNDKEDDICISDTNNIDLYNVSKEHYLK